MSYVEGSAVNIWQVWKVLYVDIYVIWNQQKNMSYVDGSAVNISVLFQKCKHVICWRLSHQHICSFSKMHTCHMLTAHPSTYDMFWLIELYGRKVQSVYTIHISDVIFPILEQHSQSWRCLFPRDDGPTDIKYFGNSLSYFYKYYGEIQLYFSKMNFKHWTNKEGVLINHRDKELKQ